MKTLKTLKSIKTSIIELKIELSIVFILFNFLLCLKTLGLRTKDCISLIKEIKKMYAGYRRIEYDLNYSAAEASRGSEVMFFSKGLRIPNNLKKCV